MKPVKFLLVCSFMTIGFLSYSQKNKVSTSTEVSNNTPFDFLNGNWIVYNNESALAAYNKFEPIADGKGIVEQYQNRKGVTSMGIFYQDPVTHHWMHTWVSDNALLTLLVHVLMKYYKHRVIRNTIFMERVQPTEKL